MLSVGLQSGKIESLKLEVTNVGFLDDDESEESIRQPKL